MAEVYAVSIGRRVEKDIFEGLFRVVSEERRGRIDKYRFREDAERALFAEALVRYGISVRYNRDREDCRFGHGEYGKPYAVGHPEWQFNVSHAGSWVVCGFGESEIGVDIEQILPVPTGLAAYSLSEREYGRFAGLGEEEKQEAFYAMWTLKESYVKYTGKGLSLPLRDFDIMLEGEGAVLTSPQGEPPFLYRRDMGPGYKLAVCTAEPSGPAVKYVSPRQVWEELCG